MARPTKQEVAKRRAVVYELMLRGWDNVEDIAVALNTTPETIENDILFLQRDARETVEHNDKLLTVGSHLKFLDVVEAELLDLYYEVKQVADSEAEDKAQKEMRDLAIAEKLRILEKITSLRANKMELQQSAGMIPTIKEGKWDKDRDLSEQIESLSSEDLVKEREETIQRVLKGLPKKKRDKFLEELDND